MAACAAAFAEDHYDDFSCAVNTASGSYLVEFFQRDTEGGFINCLCLTGENGAETYAENLCMVCGEGHFVWYSDELCCDHCGTVFSPELVPVL